MTSTGIHEGAVDRIQGGK